MQVLQKNILKKNSTKFHFCFGEKEKTPIFATPTEKDR
jgi:hypothetical protein